VNSPLDMIEEAAKRLDAILPELVFVGGATLNLYLGEDAFEEPRVTDDVDCVIEAATTLEYYRFEARLRDMGFRNCTDSGDPICRWWVGDVKVDFMPLDAEALGFTNFWYRPGMARTIQRTLPSGRTIRLFSAADLVAIKMTAHADLDRNGSDLRLNQDFEDVVVLLGSSEFCRGLVAEMPDDVGLFLSEAFSKVMRDPLFDEALSAALEASQRSSERVRQAKKCIADLALGRPKA
jgi:hypothetical protein